MEARGWILSPLGLPSCTLLKGAIATLKTMLSEMSSVTLSFSFYFVWIYARFDALAASAEAEKRFCNTWDYFISPFLARLFVLSFIRPGYHGILCCVPPVLE